MLPEIPMNSLTLLGALESMPFGLGIGYMVRNSKHQREENSQRQVIPSHQPTNSNIYILINLFDAAIIVTSKLSSPVCELSKKILLLSS
jgi:hypothetical protein